MRHALPFAFAALAFVACQTTPPLETRTFALQYIEPGTAQGLVQPYVFTDREGSPGMLSATENTITVRETTDNLERIARVLREFDVPSPWVRLHFQVIRADGPGKADPRIAAVEAELRELFRYDGYRLLAEALVSGAARSHVEQVVGTGPDPARGYVLGVDIGEVRTIGDSGFVSLNVLLRSATGGALATRINARTGQTIVLGNAQLDGEGGTTILTVRPEFVTH